jgi:hypothetical protein
MDQGRGSVYEGWKHQKLWEYIVWTGKSTVSAKTKMTFETMIADPSQQQQ